MIRPVDFADYWTTVDAELAAVPARPELEPLPFRSIPEASLYAVRLTSVSSYRILGYLSVPYGDGPFPALLETPRHGSVTNLAHVHDRRRYVVFTATHRGQRGSDQPYAAAYPGLLTDGIDDPRTYVFRAVVADCLRAAEYLLSHPKVDPARVAVRGESDVAVIAAARRSGFAAVIPLALLFHRAAERRLTTRAYPLEELNDHVRAGGSVDSTLAYFEPAFHAPEIRGTTVLGVEGDEWQLLLKALGGPVDTIALSNRGGTDADAYELWLSQQLGVPAMPKFHR
jgi:cephalosporin-C deacetylase